MKNNRNKFVTMFSDEYTQNVILNYCFKGLSVLLGLLSTKLILGYLGVTLYGLWVTITSVISWLSSGDLGIGNGLRNELAKAYGRGDKNRQDLLIFSAFRSMSKVAGLLFLLSALLFEVFFRTGVLPIEIRLAIYITSAFFCLNLLLGISQSVAYAYQKSWLTTFVTCLIQVLTITSVMILSGNGIKPNLNLFSVINGLCTTVPNIFLICFLNTKGIKVVHFEKRIFDSSISKSIMNVGIQFFGIQICGVILYSTDNLIINRVLSSDLVTKYELINKIYNTGNSLFSILLISLWSAVTYQIAQKNVSWVKRKIKQLLLLWAIYSIGVVIVSVNFNWIIRIWLGNEAIYYEKNLVILFGLYSSMTAFSAIFVNVLNGIGTIKLQFVLAVIAAVINIPLSIIFATNLHMGIFGVKFATFLSAMITAIVMPIQAIVELKSIEGEKSI